MGLSSKGCTARVVKVMKNVDGLGIIAEISTSRIYNKKTKPEYVTDFKERVLLMDNGISLNNGDMILIKAFFIRNCNGRLIGNPSYTITEWEVKYRNRYNPRYYKLKGEEQFVQAKIRQRRAIEKELEEEEQELDEYIDNNGEDNIPF